MKIFGILNLSPDSFSDGGKFQDSAQAHAQIDAWRALGVYGVDLGAVASHPKALGLPVEAEIGRLQPYVDYVRQQALMISIDSFSPEVQSHFAAQVDYLNDINGFGEPELYPLLKRVSCRLVVMHSVQRRGKADTREVRPDLIWGEILAFFDERVPQLLRAGIDRSRLILDPGMGFFLGADPMNSVIVLKNLKQLSERYGLPLYISTSRKSFLRSLSGCALAQAAVPTVVSELFALRQGVAYVRTHSPENLMFARTLEAALEPETAPG